MVSRSIPKADCFSASMEPGGSCGLKTTAAPETVLADRFEGRRLNNPNDLVLHSSGAVCTDPSGFKERDASRLKEIPWNGVCMLAPDRTVALLTKGLPFPNGLAFSPDEKTLYVAVSDAAFATHHGICHAR